jgi:histidinol dehydrogenase
MTWSEGLLAGAAILSALGAMGAVFYKRRQPELDEATAAHQLVSSDAVKTEIERASRELNAARDMRVLDLEKWADKMRPVLWKIKDRDDVMCEMVRTAYARLGLSPPHIPDFPEVPEFPPPRPMP